jgi:uncharacterized pyridoxal phosphate-containing UPF0001 family protein
MCNCTKGIQKGNKKTNKMAKQTHFSFHFQIGKLQVKKYSIINLMTTGFFFYVLKTTINSRLGAWPLTDRLVYV